MRYALAKRARPKRGARQTLEWVRADVGPSLRRLSVTTPDVLAALPKALGARPGSRYLLTTPSKKGGQEAVALGPGRKTRPLAAAPVGGPR